jgi:hypothetical protein
VWFIESPPPARETAVNPIPGVLIAKLGQTAIKEIMYSKPFVFLVLVVFISGCSKSPISENADLKNTDLKPVVGAFGYNLGETNSLNDYNELEFENSRRIRDSPPFVLLSIEKISDGRICEIDASGFVDESELDTERKKLTSILSEKYGERQKFISDIDNTESYWFGTTNRTAYLTIRFKKNTDTMVSIEYYDEGLKEIYINEQKMIKEDEDEKQKAALEKHL